ncbi:hydroxymethylbilane synthase [Intestinibacillus massiliensis]|nr:hydroxymethylbilane synthase [Intestinibacillus massiliensis]
MQEIRIGSRDSLLAVIQSETVIASIRRTDPETDVRLITMKTTGDKILDRTLDKVGGKGLFVKELDRALANHEVDFTVHSLKDMPMELADGLPIVAVSPRADVRDVLVLPEGMDTLSPELPIGCSSARRRIQLQRLFPGYRIESVRGNVQTRLRKLDGGQYGALVLAAAGLHRLGLEHRISRYFSVDEILPAAGQAIIAVQGRAGEDTGCLRGYHDPDAMACMLAERAFVRKLDGGCSSPVAAYAHLENGRLHVRGMYVSEDEKNVCFGERTGLPGQAAQLGTLLAEQLMAEGGKA